MQKRFVLPFIVALILFLSAGYTSGSVFRFGHDFLYTPSLLPGAIFIAATILLFPVMRIPLKPLHLLVYTGGMYCTYLLVFYATLITSYVGIIFGIATCGAGAVLTFWFTSQFILKIKYRPVIPFVYGAAAFLLNDLLVFTAFSEKIKLVSPFSSWMDSSFSFAYFFWQAMVGLLLYFTLQKAKAAISVNGD